jgi:GNAT superfamily N-acetyltransferase
MEGRDVGAVVDLWNRTLVQDTTTEARFALWLFADPDHDPVSGEGAWIAESDGQPLGFIRALKRTFPNDLMGAEEDDAWIPAVFVAPERQRRGIGTGLLEGALESVANRGAKRVWVCGNTGSAPGYVFPGVDKDAYAAGLAFFLKSGFVVDHEPVAMAGSLIDLDHERLHAEAWAQGTTQDVRVEPLRPDTVQPFLGFLRRSFPGDWNTAARGSLRSGGLGRVLLAWLGDEVVGYCQWEGEHFGPFGVRTDVRGKRLGAKLFVEAMRRIKGEDGRSVWFNWADEDAARFYRRFGLRETRRFAILRRDL